MTVSFDLEQLLCTGLEEGAAGWRLSARALSQLERLLREASGPELTDAMLTCLSVADLSRKSGASEVAAQLLECLSRHTAKLPAGTVTQNIASWQRFNSEPKPLPAAVSTRPRAVHPLLALHTAPSYADCL